MKPVEFEVKTNDFFNNDQIDVNGFCIGSSTLCLLALNKHEHTLTSLNIGDSGFVIYRQGEIIRRSKSTMNHDGCGPKQLFAVNGSLGLPCFISEK